MHDRLQNCMYLETYSDWDGTMHMMWSTSKRQGDKKGLGQVAGKEAHTVKDIISQC
jgi:hypothetical protein